MITPPLTEAERRLAASYGPQVYGAFLVLRSAAHGAIREEPAVKIAKNRLRRP